MDRQGPKFDHVAYMDDIKVWDEDFLSFYANKCSDRSRCHYQKSKYLENRHPISSGDSKEAYKYMGVQVVKTLRGCNSQKSVLKIFRIIETIVNKGFLNARHNMTLINDFAFDHLWFIFPMLQVSPLETASIHKKISDCYGTGFTYQQANPMAGCFSLHLYLARQDKTFKTISRFCRDAYIEGCVIVYLAIPTYSIHILHNKPDIVLIDQGFKLPETGSYSDTIHLQTKYSGHAGIRSPEIDLLGNSRHVQGFLQAANKRSKLLKTVDQSLVIGDRFQGETLPPARQVSQSSDISSRFVSVSSNGEEETEKPGVLSSATFINLDNGKNTAMTMTPTSTSGLSVVKSTPICEIEDSARIEKRELTFSGSAPWLKDADMNGFGLEAAPIALLEPASDESRKLSATASPPNTVPSLLPRQTAVDEICHTIGIYPEGQKTRYLPGSSLSKNTQTFFAKPPVSKTCLPYKTRCKPLVWSHERNACTNHTPDSVMCPFAGNMFTRHGAKNACLPTGGIEETQSFAVTNDKRMAM
ncbi:hypothetical protein RF11_10312 [Thelohanellus kitauei]|uniref:Uncharacterized protein n=1 Tax=Thelohanellus kitauei TaxID=669202 RepID=A0A0C2J9H8_THEKT|nr:hypothetical protein RF11_10312 [Thelohanellus kitauei]